MKTIKLHTPKYFGDDKTQTVFDVTQISHVESMVFDDDKDGTYLYLLNGERVTCWAAASSIRNMIEEAKAMEEIALNSEAVNLLINAAKDGAHGLIHFVESSGCLVAGAAGFQTGLLMGRERSRYEAARRQLLSYELAESDGGEVHHLTERGFAIADHLTEDGVAATAFRGNVKLPERLQAGAAPVTRIGIQFNQTNNNTGDVNNVVSESGNAEQNVRNE
jgi:hypothetical protein